jgi:hypothetical protein
MDIRRLQGKLVLWTCLRYLRAAVERRAGRAATRPLRNALIRRTSVEPRVPIRHTTIQRRTVDEQRQSCIFVNRN